MNLAMLIAISGSAAGAPPGFDRDVRPILANHCWQCHGPDAGQRKGKLRLDIRADAVKSAIVPGKPDESPLLERIGAEDAEEVMPPPHAKKPLTASQKETLKAWIAAGAPYESHWAFSPIANPTPPKVKDEKKVRNAIDRFVLAKLEAQKLSLSDEATPRTLLRRAWLDLVGLPPTAEEQARFDSDPPETRYERAVERLLASPHYGEKWGRHWLDQARYADSNGYTVDGDRTMWPFRDWVIKAHNDDMPFSQFTVEQLAGDLLPNATKLQRLATGFHRNTMINEEGGVDAEQFRCESAVDRVNTTGAVWLGLTVGCAQCHSHKYDPISHKEYFELYAFFNQQADVNNRGPTIEVAPGEVLGPAPAAKKTNEPDWAKVRAEWEKRVASDKSPEPKWQAAKLDGYTAQSNRVLKKLDDGSILAMAEGSPNDAYFVQFHAPTKKVGAIRIRVLLDKSLPAGGPGTAKNGNFVLTEAELSLDGKNLPFTLALADHAKDKHGPELAIDADRTTGWALEMAKGGKGQHDLWLSLPQAIEVGDKPLSLSLRHDVNDRYLVGRFRIDTAESPALAHPDAMLWKSVKAAAPKAAGKRSEAEKKVLQRAFVEYHPRAEGAVVNTTTVMVMQESEKPRTTYIHRRGDFLSPDTAVGSLTPNTPAALPPLRPAKEKPTRLDLARWLVRPDHPLTARVAANRIWMRYFGEGLVQTENDFGAQGSAPTHPELLDYLASKFIADGWSMKKLHRLIVTSATYRQQARTTPELREADPYNRYLARQSRMRLEAEAVRDSALAAAGLIDLKIGGPTVFPYQPEGVYAFTQVKRVWKQSDGGDGRRRTMYTRFYRSAPHPLFGTFDAPSFSTVCTRRNRSNTPLQALLVANDPAFLECAQGLAARAWKEAPATGAEGERIERIFSHALGRKPEAGEEKRCEEFLKSMRAAFSKDEKAALAASFAKPAANASGPENAAEGAAWAALARAVLATDEFLTRE